MNLNFQSGLSALPRGLDETATSVNGEFNISTFSMESESATEDEYGGIFGGEKKKGEGESGANFFG